MKLSFTACMLLGCLGLSHAQGVQGSVRISGQVTIVVIGHSVTLNWNASQNAASYSLYRGNQHGGPYTKVASGIASPAYIDVQVTHGQTLYYVTTAVSGTRESGYSGESVAVIP